MEGLSVQEVNGELRLILLPPRKPTGYCVHKYKIKSGALSKLELFAYFKQEVLLKILEQTEELSTVKGVTYPPYFNQEGKYFRRHRAIIMWNKAPVFIKCYQARKTSDHFKLEVTRGKVKGVGKKFLEPVSTLNSLGGLIKFLTNNAMPIFNLIHSDFLFIDEFLETCKKEFVMRGRSGQLRLVKEQKLRGDIQFGFKIR